ncbi:hypothetical protein PMI30_05983 [Pseudomonas sp. GM50]|uniref:hypothetical protein n=1 Tax=Pseudomonas sp. GM50 TaxID=1144332 RepID=UPI000270B8A7|nr:hypothetical protein [Pseudomonas sp. GM50]EJM58966.1 hypothetical protein PMI30_05983 [Pseudomonas sp. GM50]
MQIIQACTGILSLDAQHSRDTAITENPDNATSTSHQESKSHHRFWAQNRTLDISITSNFPSFKELVKESILTWAPHINLTLRFVEGNEGVIRIIDTPDALERNGHWSAIGTDALLIPSHVPTIQIHRRLRQSDLGPTILHMFGHALGLEHAHQHPDANIDWHLPNLYKGYGEIGYSRNQVLEYILPKQRSAYTQLVPYDKCSIMHFPFPKEVIFNDIEYGYCDELSDGDIKAISAIYPVAS